MILLGFITLVLGVTARPRLAPAWLTLLGVIEVTGPGPLASPGDGAGRAAAARRVEAYAPQFAVYFASTVGAGYQVGMWLPYFMRIGRPFVIDHPDSADAPQIERSVPSRGSRCR